MTINSKDSTYRITTSCCKKKALSITEDIHHPASPPSYPEGSIYRASELGPHQVVGQATEPQLLNDGGSCGLFIHSFSGAFKNPILPLFLYVVTVVIGGVRDRAENIPLN